MSCGIGAREKKTFGENSKAEEGGGECLKRPEFYTWVGEPGIFYEITN